MLKVCPACGKPLPMKTPAICPSCGGRIEVPGDPPVIRGRTLFEAPPKENPVPATAPLPEPVSPAPAVHQEIRIPALAVILSFFFAGWGQWYNGKTWDGLKFFAGTLVVYILAIITIAGGFRPVPQLFGLVLGAVTLAIWVYGMYEAYMTAGRINNGEEEFSGKSLLFWLPVLMVILMVVLLLASLVLATLIFGMAGSASHIHETKVVAATVQQPDANTMIITYQGGQDADKLRQLIAMATDSKGSSQTKTISSPDPATPLKVGTTITMTGAFSGKDHVVVTAGFSDGTWQVILDNYV